MGGCGETPFENGVSPHPFPGTPKALQVHLGEPRPLKLQKKPVVGAICSHHGLLLRKPGRPRLSQNGRINCRDRRPREPQNILRIF